MKKIVLYLIAFLLIAGNASYIIGDEEFVKILDSNDTEKIMKMLNDNPELMKKDLGRGKIVLDYAAYYGNNTVLDYLLKNGNDLNHKDNLGRTPLFFAVVGVQPEMVKRLIDLGADLKYKNELGESLIFHACAMNNLETVKLLLEHGFDINQQNKYGQTPVFAALQKGNVEIIKYLKSKGIDLNQKMESGMGFLHFAVFSAKPELINYLVDEGLDINAVSAHGDTPLLLAISVGATPSAVALAERGADVNLADSNGETAFSYAIKRGEKELADLFIKHKANVNTVNSKTGRTVLEEAAARGYSAIVDLLLKNGADKDAKDRTGHTALSYALKYGNEKAAEVLKNAKAEYIKWDKNLGYSEYLSKPLAENEAYIWYLKHSGWVVKTKSALLIFDYWDDTPSPDLKLLANGHINTEEIKNFPVYVFVSHIHPDHYNKKIFEWKKDIPNIKYIFGFENEETKGTIYVEPRSQQKIDNLTVTTIKSNDSGVGFAVQLDGFTLFHAGDHSNNTLEEPNDFFPEINFLAEKGIKADIAFFLNMYGCGSSNPEAFEKGIYYALDKLKTKVVFPQHAAYREWVYQNLADDVARDKKPVEVGVASISGDRFHYKDGGLMK